MKEKIILILILIFMLQYQVIAATSANQTVTASLTRLAPPSPDPVIPGGVIVGIVGGGIAAGVSALAFAPLLLAGLEPNSVMCAAAPINCISPLKCYLKAAIKYHGGIRVKNGQFVKVKDKYYFAQNDCEILNGTYDVDEIKLPEELKSAKKIKVSITITSQGYSEAKGEPELAIGIYKNINRQNLNKKFETQQFLKHYMMKKYEIPLQTTLKQYGQGIQKLSGVIYLDKIEYKNSPLKIVMRYADGGFRRNLRRNNPKVLIYAYIIELQKIM